MSGIYFNPIKRIFLNLSGGTVTGNTVFTEGVYATRLSGGTIYSGSTELTTIIQNVASSFSGITGSFLPITGGTGGPYEFIGSTSADTVIVSNIVEPSVDNSVDLGSSIKRFRSLNTVDGIAVNFTASTKIKTAQIELGTKTVTDTNIILTGQCIYGGSW
jgi:hypothetical protein